MLTKPVVNGAGSLAELQLRIDCMEGRRGLVDEELIKACLS